MIQPCLDLQDTYFQVCWELLGLVRDIFARNVLTPFAKWKYGYSIDWYHCKSLECWLSLWKSKFTNVYTLLCDWPCKLYYIELNWKFWSKFGNIWINIYNGLITNPESKPVLIQNLRPEAVKFSRIWLQIFWQFLNLTLISW